jgi:probable rRNA maturation factor
MPKSPKFEEIKETILGSKYELSFVFVSAKKIRALNKTYRNIDRATDILSFPLSKNSGEILICKSETRKMMAEFGRTYDNFLAFLFIHGCVHLKGFDHGTKMEKVEEKFRKLFRV